MKQYPPVIDLVTEFHTTYSQVIRTSPVFDVPEKDFRHDLINEEVEELAAAYGSNDFIEVIDALADIVYVVAGGVLTHGAKLNYHPNVPMFKVKANRSLVVDEEFFFVKEFFGEEYKHWRTTEGTLRLWKNLQAVPEKIRDYEFTTWVEWYAERTGHAAEIVHKFAFANWMLNTAETIDEMVSAWHELVHLAYETAASYGVNLDEILEEVQRSNLSKLDENGNVIKNAAGKVLKGKNFFTPDIEGVLSRGL